MQAGIYNALLTLGATTSTIENNCATGNCTFEPFTTLAFCSTCKDLTAKITPVCAMDELCYDRNSTMPSDFNSPALHNSTKSVQFNTTCHYNIPVTDPEWIQDRPDAIPSTEADYTGGGYRGFMIQI